MRALQPARVAATDPQFGPAHAHAIEQSHQRCAALGVSRIARPDLAPIARTELLLARERNRRLHEHAAPVMELLHGQIANTQSMVVLTDATGTVLLSIGDDEFLERAHKVALRPGANWSESVKGTNAVGTALVQETPVLVHAGEHYLHANSFLTCSAAPILCPRGNLLGVLDVSGDHRGYHQHTMALVTMSARMIENRWLTDDHRRLLRLHFHSRPGFIGTLMEGILALDADGRIVGANRGALEQLGCSGAALRQHTLGTLLGRSMGALLDQLRQPAAGPLPLTLADGRQMHAVARFNWPVWGGGADTAAPAPAPAALAPVRPRALEALRTGCTAFDSHIEPARRVCERGIALLIEGETGTGKRTLAQALHADSPRGHAPFVVLDSETLADPATSATRLAAARGGTLFLPSVDELPPAQQARLAALLPPTLAVISTSRCGLRERVAAGAFRDDLFHRLNGLALRLPPLREYGGLAPLLHSLLQREDPSHPRQLSQEVSGTLQAAAWPGNLRQLHQVLRTACALAGDEVTITSQHLAADLPAPAAPPANTLQDLEIDAIRRAVQVAQGNIALASRRLGISRNTIYRKLRPA